MTERYKSHECAHPSCNAITRNKLYHSRECFYKAVHEVVRNRSYTRDELENAVASSSSLPRVLQALGIPTTNGGYNRVLRDIERLGVKKDHFLGQGWNIGNRLTAEERYARFEAKLGPDTDPRSDWVKLLVNNGVREHRCYECRLKTWRKQPIPLQCDHVDGNRRNNTLENLRLLCANCHMQTSTWGRRTKHA